MTDLVDDQTNSTQNGSAGVGSMGPISTVPGPLGSGSSGSSGIVGTGDKSDSNVLSFEEHGGQDRRAYDRDTSLLNKRMPKDTADKIITARGNEHGLVLRIDGRAQWDQVTREVRSFLGGKRRFFEGGEITIEWLDAMPSRERCLELESMLRDDYGVQVPRRGRAVPLKEVPAETPNSGRESSGRGVTRLSSLLPASPNSTSVPGGVPGFSENNSDLDDWQDGSDSESFILGDLERSRVGSRYADADFDREYVARVAKLLGDDMGQEEEANARLVFGTLRSGQKVETPYSLIVVGDVNPGADLIAGGDIIVLGSLRGTAHASAYDDEFQDRVIIALHMHPMQLRIGTIISRGGEDGGRGAEIAHIEERRIVVEGFSSKILQRRRGRI